MKCRMCEVGWLTLGVLMDAKTRVIVLIKYKTIIQGFKDAIAEARKKGANEARIAALKQLPPTLIPT